MEILNRKYTPTDFLSLVRAEILKTKGSSIKWLTVAGALFMPVILLSSRLAQHSRAVIENSLEGAWLKILNQSWEIIAPFILPMGIILTCSIIMQIEFRNNTWKQLLSAPVSYPAVFLSKLTILFKFLLQFFILVNIGLILPVCVPAIIYSDVPLPSDTFPFVEFIKLNYEFFVRCLPILAIQFLLSLHIRSFVLPIAIGFALMITSWIAARWSYGHLIPYSYAALQYLNDRFSAEPTFNITVWSLGYFLVITLANYLIWIYSGRISFIELRFIRNRRTIAIIFSVFIVMAMSLIVIVSGRESRPPSNDNSRLSIHERISNVENNLGSFHAQGPIGGWTIHERMKYYNIQGLSIAVVNDYKIEWAKGYGWADEANRKPVSIQTMFLPGSISKSINAAGILKLSQLGRVSLYSDVNQYLKRWKVSYNSYANGKNITLLHLLSHSSGLSVHGFAGYDNSDSLPTLPQILKGERPANNEKVVCLFEPGTKYLYSGGGIVLSQLLIEDVCNKRYEDFFREEVFQQLGMRNSTFEQPLPNNLLDQAAVGYDSSGREITCKRPILPEKAAGGLWATPVDICKYIIGLQQSLKGDSRALLNKVNCQLMLTPYLDEEHALGFTIRNVNGSKYFYHMGANRGFSGVFFGSFDGGKGLAIFTNSENPEILREVAESIFSEYGWEGFEKKEKVQIQKINNSILQSWVGKYVGAENGIRDTVEILIKNSKPYTSAKGKIHEIYPISSTKFVNMEVPTIKELIKDDQGEVSQLMITFHNRKRIFRRIGT